MRKLKRKPHKLEEITKEPVKKKKIFRYKKKRCSFVYPEGNRCTCNCVGNGNVCATHGGVRGAKESLITTTGMLQTLNMKYDAANHPIKFLELSREGMSDVEIAAEFKISIHQLRGWVEKYKEFSIAYEIGQAMHEAWWLNQGKDNLGNRSYQTGLFKFLTGNKLGWSDKIETKNINQNSYGVLLVPGTMSVDEWEQANIREEEAIDIEGEVTDG